MCVWWCRWTCIRRPLRGAAEAAHLNLLRSNELPVFAVERAGWEAFEKVGLPFCVLLCLGRVLSLLFQACCWT